MTKEILEIERQIANVDAAQSTAIQQGRLGRFDSLEIDKALLKQQLSSLLKQGPSD